MFVSQDQFNTRQLLLHLDVKILLLGLIKLCRTFVKLSVAATDLLISVEISDHTAEVYLVQQAGSDKFHDDRTPPSRSELFCLGS